MGWAALSELRTASAYNPAKDVLTGMFPAAEMTAGAGEGRAGGGLLPAGRARAQTGRGSAGAGEEDCGESQRGGKLKSKVAFITTSPETVLEDYQRLFRTGGRDAGAAAGPDHRC